VRLSWLDNAYSRPGLGGSALASSECCRTSVDDNVLHICTNLLTALMLTW